MPVPLASQTLQKLLGFARVILIISHLLEISRIVQSVMVLVWNVPMKQSKVAALVIQEQKLTARESVGA